VTPDLVSTAILGVGAPAGDKGNHTAFVVIIVAMIVALVVFIAWAIKHRGRADNG
jgi:hypothetical protein